MSLQIQSNAATQTTIQAANQAVRSLDIRPVAGRIGVEIRGIDLSANLSEDVVRAIRQVLVKYKVIFFRGQQLDASGQAAFARRFGQITTAHPTVPSLPDHPEILDLDYGNRAGRANHWHTDVTFVDRPPLGSILRAIKIPPVGGDTVWANTATAYQDLPAPLQTLADQLWAVHTNAYDYVEAAVDFSEPLRDFHKVFTATVYETLHPVVQVHPESGERSLLLGGFVRQLQGFSTAESTEIVRLLQAYVTRPENTVRWQWQAGDVAFWDNRATQHYAIDDFGNQDRHVQRITIVGDLPVSIDGRTSQAIKGDSSTYNQLQAA